MWEPREVNQVKGRVEARVVMWEVRVRKWAEEVMVGAVVGGGAEGGTALW